MDRHTTAFAAACCAFLSGATVPGALVAQASDSTACVFVGDAPGGAEGAPTKDSLGRLVLLSDLEADDPFAGGLRRLEEGKQPEATLRYRDGDVAALRPALLELLPEFVLVVTRPERIDVNLQFALLELAAGLDGDPFVDFAHGFVTGATAAEAMALVEHIVAGSPLPKGKGRERVLDFGPAANGALQEGGPIGHPLAKGWKRSWLYHGSVQEMLERQDQLAEFGVLRAGGHGEPDRIVDGLSAADLRAADALDLGGALYFSGPCYCGVTVASYRPGSSGMIERQTIEPTESFGLAVLARGAGALFAGLDPDRGEQSEQELEHLWMCAGTLGHAIKDTYDSTTIALREPVYALFRYEAGAARPQRELAMTMIGGAAGRVLFGDPTARPFAKPVAEHPLGRATLKDGKKTLTATIQSKRLPNAWQCHDVFRCEGRWTHRLQLRQEISATLAAELSGLTRVEVEAKSGPIEPRFPTAMIERWGGKCFLHLYVVFEPGGLPVETRDLRATFHFAKTR